MSKVFEALEILGRALEFNDEGEFQSGRLWRIIFNDMVDDKEKSIIEQALAELKQIKEAKPSEVLECIDRCYCALALNDCYEEEYNIIKNYILKTQDNEKKLNFYEKVKTMLKQKDAVLRYVESEDCFATRTMMSAWYKLTPQFIDDNIREEVKVLPVIEKVKQLRVENFEYKQVLDVIIAKEVDMSIINQVGSYMSYNEAYLRIKGFTFSKGKLLTEAEFEMIKKRYMRG